MTTHADEKHESSGGRLVTLDGKALPLRAVEISADAKGGLARTVVRQTFANPYEEPLKVTYQLPLPADGAVSGFTFTVGDERISGEVDRKAAARERFERALVEGRSASLLEQDRSSLFTQEVGNIPPGQEVKCEVVIDQPLAWLSEGAWEWRFPTVVAPRYQGAAGRVSDSDRQRVDVSEAPPAVDFTARLSIRDSLPDLEIIESPSHPIGRKRAGGATSVELVKDGATRPALDRDVVVRWKVAQPTVGLSLDVARPESGALSETGFGLLTLVPPSVRARGVRRDLILLIDTSGSMGGEPLDQARRVASALVDTLGEEDRLEMIEFSDEARRWTRAAVPATAKNKKGAIAWLRKLEASGSTEMHEGILAALRSLDDEAQRQVVLMTDGLIGFESEIVHAIAHECPKGSRVHTVGIGSSVNRSLTGPAARAGRGVEVVIGLGEDPERSAQKLVAATDAPCVVNVSLEGSALLEHGPARIPDLFAGAPSRVALKLRPEGGTLRVTGRTANGAYAEAIEVPACEVGTGSKALAALFGRERVEDLELELASGESGSKRNAEIERLGLLHRISTRLTSWVAVSQKVTVDPRDPTRTERMPQALPYGMSVEGFGLRQMAPPPPMAAMPMASMPRGAIPRRTSVAGAMPPPRAKERMKKLQVPFEPEEEPLASADFGAPGDVDDLFGEVEEGALEDDEALPIAERVEPMAEKLTERLPSGGAPKPRGRVVLRTAKELVLEVTLVRGTEWTPDAKVLLQFADGTELALEVVTERSTKAGNFPADTVLRIVLACFEGMTLATPVEAMLAGLGGGCTVRLDG